MLIVTDCKMAFVLRQNTKAALETFQLEARSATALDFELPGGNSLTSVHLKDGLSVSVPVSKKVFNLF